MNAVDIEFVEELVAPVGECLTPEVAQRLVDLRADARLQSRIDQLAEKSTAGTLTERERSQYEQYVRFWQFMTILQIKAREVSQ